MFFFLFMFYLRLKHVLFPLLFINTCWYTHLLSLFFELMFSVRLTTFLSPPKDQVFAQQSGCEMRDVGAVLEASTDSECIEHLASQSTCMHRTIALKRLKRFQDN